MANKTVTVMPSGGDYTSLAAAIAGEVTANADLVSNEMILTISIEGDWSGGADTAAVNVDGFTTSSDYYVKIIADDDNKAGTSLDTDKYILSRPTAYSVALQIDDNYTQVIGLQLYSNQTTVVMLRMYKEHLLIDGLFINGGEYGIYDAGALNNNNVILNTIVVGPSKNGYINAGSTSFIYNSVFVCCGETGVSTAAYRTTTCKNCYSGNNTGDDYNEVANSTLTLTTCFSDDGTKSTSTAAYSTDNFTNVTAGSEDLSLPSGSDLIDEGTDLSEDATFPFDWDINGTTRSGTWDVGAYEYTSGSPTVDNLTAASAIVTSNPVLGTPSIGQEHALSYSDLVTGAPVLGTPTIGQEHALTATGIVTGAPVLGAPVLGITHALIPDSIVTGAPEIGTPTIGQVHYLLGDNLVTGNPVLGEPAVGAPGTDALTSENLLTGNPDLGIPSLGQVHALTSDTIVSGSPDLGTPALGQVHALSADSLVTGAPVLGTPVMVEIPAGELLPDSILCGAPVLGEPIIRQVQHLLPDSILTGEPVLGRPVLDAVLISGVVYITIADYKIPGMDLSYKIPSMELSYKQPSVSLTVKGGS